MTITSRQETRLAVLRDLERSGLSMAEYCRRHGLVYGTVASWRCVLRRNRRHEVQAQREEVRFVEVETMRAQMSADDEAAASSPAVRSGIDALPPALCAELVLPGGAVLRVYAPCGKGGAA